MASHLVSLWKWDFLELGNGLLDFSFFPTLGFPTHIRIQIEFARPHVSDKYLDYFYYPGLP